VLQRRTLAVMGLFVALAAPQPLVLAAAMKEIDEASSAAREAARRAIEAANDKNTPEHEPARLPPSVSTELNRLERALERGEQINSSLRSEVQALERERAQLVQVQAVLTSGLVGALVTAVVAVAGAVVSSRNSRPERDLKKLAVLEKLHELRGAGVQVPADIEATYSARKSEARSASQGTTSTSNAAAP
jgi:Flp pilus assembly protein TadB